MADNEWDEYADDWDLNPQTATYASNAYSELQKVYKLKNARIFDFGCGTGLLTELLSPSAAEIVALDSSSKMIEALRKKNLQNVHAMSASLTTSFIKTEACLNSKFDLIVASSVCAFLPDYSETLSLLKSLLKEGGTFVQWDWLSSGEEKSMGFSVDELHTNLKNTMFRNIKISEPFDIEGMAVVMAVAQK